MNDVPAVISRIENDFTQQKPPFDKVEFPEKRLLRELATDGDNVWRLSAEDKLAAISLFSTLDYNRDANQLADKILEVSERDGLNIFDAHEVSKSKNGVEYLFEDVPFRYKSRDANAWHKNCSILVEKYNGRWHELLLDVGCDASSLVKRLKEDDFNCLKGVKIAPMYARIIDDEVCNLHNMWRLDIPVDTHIRRLSTEFFQSRYDTTTEPADGKIRAFWLKLAEEYDISRHVVDGALWHIGNNWDEWGEDYWRKVTK
jgi:hypothetical protein